ncbi:Cytochrome c oxidase subunit 4 [Entophlyctis luteolus]|nr:Cytochrome c oxidase subunit 4 [Entophlyctis luteolus]
MSTARFLMRRACAAAPTMPMSARFVSVSARAMAEKPSSDLDPYNVPIPGYRAPGQIAHNWELATGNERYEYVKRLAGEEPWEDMQPYILKAKPTAQNPFVVTGTDPEKYLGCTGFPADTHEAVWLTLRPHNGVDRCPHCGNAYKYKRAEAHHH